MPTIINEDFIKRRPVSYSRLKEFRKSPRHYVASFEKPFIESDQMLIGSVTDCLLIEGEEAFNLQYQPYSSFPKRSNDAKAEWAQMVDNARTEKKRLVSNEIIVTAKECVQAIRDYPDAQQYLNMRKRHQRIRWTDRETKLPCVGVTDWDCLIDEQLVIVDLKTAASADPEDFTRDAWKWEYFLQVGAYLEGYKHAYFQFPMFVFIVVETTELHNVSINFVEAKYAEFCREEWKGTLRAFRKCLDNDMWDSGYEYRLMDTGNYFALRKPGYGKPRYGFFD